MDTIEYNTRENLIAAALQAQNHAGFESLLSNLASEINADAAVIGVLSDDTKNHVQTLSFLKDHQFNQNFEYSLENTPCAKVISGQPCFYPTGIQARFPDDRMLCEAGFDGYVGIPLTSPDTGPFGILLALRYTPFEDEPRVLNAIHLFAMRARNEFERLQNDAIGRSAVDPLPLNNTIENQRFQDVLHLSSDWIWETDKDLRFSYFSEGFYKTFGWSEGAGMGLSGKEIEERGLWEVRPRQSERMRQLMTAHSYFRNEECVFQVPGQGTIYLRISGMPLLNAEGEFTGYRGVSINITEQKLAETQQRINEHRYRRLYNDTPVIMHSLDRNGTICDVNGYWLETMGYERSEVMGRPIQEFHTEESRKRLVEEVLPCFFQDGYCKDIPYQLRKKNGQVIDVLLSANGYRDAEGNIVRSEATMIDVTIQKRYDALSEIHETLLRESERRYRAIIESAADAIFVLDISGKPYGQLIDVNPTACENLGYSKEELLNMTIADIEVKLDTSEESLRSYKAPPGEATTLYGVLRRKNGSEFPVSVRTRAVKHDNRYIVIAVARDETENLSYQEALQEAKTRAESALKTAEQASRAKSDFLANMSHELRTPLNAINGFSESLEILNQKGMLSTDKAAEYLDYIKGSGQHLLGLINDLLDYSAIEAGKLELNQVQTNVEELVEAAVLMVAKRIDDCGQTLNVSVEDDLPDILVDQLRIKQVLVNLLNNASKFTPEGGSIAVRTSMGGYANLNITIKDSGKGMDEEEIQIALERFGRARGSCGHEGTGLGLPLSRELIIAHNRQLKIESRPNIGTTVTVSLPINGRSDSVGDGDSIPN